MPSLDAVSPMPLIIVDDCPLNLAILKRLASERGAREVVAFTNPVKALGHLASNTADLLILDHSMEEVDGLEMTRRLRASALHRTTPIVMVTGSEEPDVRSQAQQAGVSDFLEKPIDVAQFKAVLSGLLADGGWPYVDRRERDGERPLNDRRRA